MPIFWGFPFTCYTYSLCHSWSGLCEGSETGLRGLLWECCGNAVPISWGRKPTHSHATLTTSTPSATLGQACVKGERQGCGDCYGNAVVMLCRFCANLLGIPIHILHLLPSIHCQNPNQTPLHSPIRGW